MLVLFISDHERNGGLIMNLKKILVGIDGIKAKGEIDREVTTIEKDSRKVVEGSMFFAIKGFTTDGTQYINSAIEKGAKTILVEETTDIRSLNIPEDVTIHHKTGEADGITHDIGIVYSKNPFIIGFASNETNTQEFEDIIRKISRFIYEESEK